MYDGDLPRWREALRAVGLAVWSWLALAAMLSVYSGDLAADAVGGLSQSGNHESIQAAIGGPVETFVSIATLQFGRSWVLSPETSAWALIGQRAGPTLVLLALTLVLAGAIGWGLASLARRDPRAGAALGAVGAVPGVGWLYLLLFAGTNGLVPLQLPASGTGLVAPALALALPVGFGAARVAGRAAVDPREWALDGWQYAIWLPTAIVVAEAVFAVNGLGDLWFRSLTSGDFPLFASVSAVLSLPLVLASVGRELWWYGDGTSDATTAAGATTDGGTASASSLAGDRLVVGGAATLAVVLLVGLVGSAVTSPPPRMDPSSFLLPRVLDAMGAVAVLVLVAGVVASLVGIVGGVVAGIARPAGTAVRAVLDPVGNVPLGVVLLVGITSLWGLRGRISPWMLGGVGAYPIAAMVVRVVERERRQRPDASDVDALREGVGVVASGVALLVFVVAGLSMLGLGPRALTFALGNSTYPATATVETLLVVVPTVLGLFALGEGLGN